MLVAFDGVCRFMSFEDTCSSISANLAFTKKELCVEIFEDCLFGCIWPKISS